MHISQQIFSSPNALGPLRTQPSSEGPGTIVQGTGQGGPSINSAPQLGAPGAPYVYTLRISLDV